MAKHKSGELRCPATALIPVDIMRVDIFEIDTTLVRIHLHRDNVLHVVDAIHLVTGFESRYKKQLSNIEVCSTREEIY